MKIFRSVMVVLILLPMALNSEQAWFVVSGRISALSPIVPFEGGFTGMQMALGAARDNMELRLDSAVMELQFCDPERFERIFDKYGLRFAGGGLVDETAMVDCTIRSKTPWARR